jgi:hypothetical protein
LSTVATSPGRLRDDLVGLVHRGAHVSNFALGAARILARAVPFEGVCVSIRAIAATALAVTAAACRRGVDRYGIGGILEPIVAAVIGAEHFGGTASLKGVS